MDLVSEVGELGKEIIKGCNYGKQEYTNTPNIESELGDCLFSLLALCHEMGIDADNALNTALTKYKKRFNSKGEIGSGEQLYKLIWVSLTNSYLMGHKNIQRGKLQQ